MAFFVQQDLQNSSIIKKLKCDRWNTVGMFETHDEAADEKRRLESNPDLGYKQCPIRIIEMPADTVVAYLGRKRA